MRARHALLTTKGNPRKAADVSPGKAEAMRARSAAKAAESADGRPAMESSAAISAACPASNPTFQSLVAALSFAARSRRAVGHVRQESVLALPVVDATRATRTR